MRCPCEGRRGDARTTTSLPASPPRSLSWSISSCATLGDSSDSACRTEHPGPAQHPVLPWADIYLNIGKSFSSARLKYCPISSHSFSPLLFLPCFTLVEENCFDCIFLVDIKYLSKQGHSPWSYDSTHEDNGSGWVCCPRCRQGAATLCRGGFSPDSITAQHPEFLWGGTDLVSPLFLSCAHLQ